MTRSLRRTLVRAALLVTMLVVALGGRAVAQSVAGQRFVIAFPDTTKNSFDARYPNRAYPDAALVAIHSAVATRARIRGLSYDSTVTVERGAFTIIDLSRSQRSGNPAGPIVNTRCRVDRNSFSIEADAPVVVYQYLVTTFGTEAWTALPIDAWGTEYVAAAMPGEVGVDVWPGGEFDYNVRNKPFPAEILIVAAHDDTRITVTANGRVDGECAPSDVRLDAGEVYQLQSWVDTARANVGVPQSDLGGSRIVATKPVGVISGNSRAQLVEETIGLGKNIFKNMLVEWLSPTTQHGTEFIVMPTWDRLNATASGIDTGLKRPYEVVRVYASTDGTTATYLDANGEEKSFGSMLDRGQVATMQMPMSHATVVRTSRPAQVMMHTPAVVRYAGTTSGFGGYIGAAYDGWGGHMVELAPRQRWATAAPVFVPANPVGMEHRINIVTDAAWRNDILMADGSRVVFDRTVPGTSLVWTTVTLPRGGHDYVRGRNGASFFGIVYGTMAKGGHEEYRPGRMRRDHEPPLLVAGGGLDDDGGDAPLHPSEYEEYLAIAYSYPLAAQNAAPVPPPIRLHGRPTPLERFSQALPSEEGGRSGATHASQP